jgi:hypothetical protein
VPGLLDGRAALPTGNSTSLPLAGIGAGLVAVGALVVFGVRRSSGKGARHDVSV